MKKNKLFKNFEESEIFKGIEKAKYIVKLESPKGSKFSYAETFSVVIYFLTNIYCTSKGILLKEIPEPKIEEFSFDTQLGINVIWDIEYKELELSFMDNGLEITFNGEDNFSAIEGSLDMLNNNIWIFLWLMQ